jgi:hypothetical protein
LELLVCESGVGGMVGTLTGTPADERMVATSVGEKSKSDDAFAASNLRFVILGRASGSPRIILISCEVSLTGGVGGGSSFELELGSAKLHNQCYTSGYQHSFTTIVTFATPEPCSAVLHLIQAILYRQAARLKDHPKR